MCKLSNEEAVAFWNLMMVSDPWPLTKPEENVLQRLADNEAKARGFDSWYVAYHEKWKVQTKKHK